MWTATPGWPDTFFRCGCSTSSSFVADWPGLFPPPGAASSALAAQLAGLLAARSAWKVWLWLLPHACEPEQPSPATPCQNLAPGHAPHLPHIALIRVVPHVALLSRTLLSRYPGSLQSLSTTYIRSSSSRVTFSSMSVSFLSLFHALYIVPLLSLLSISFLISRCRSSSRGQPA